MTVQELISLLLRCDPDAKVVWDYDGMTARPTSVERCRDGSVELLVDDLEMLDTLRELGRDVISP